MAATAANTPTIAVPRATAALRNHRTAKATTPQPAAMSAVRPATPNVSSASSSAATATNNVPASASSTLRRTVRNRQNAPGNATAANSKTNGYSSTRSNTTGASKALNVPPADPPNANQT